MSSPREISAFGFKHLFAVTGFMATAIAIIALTIFYRDMIVQDIVLQGERQNQLLAQSALNSVKHELINYLRGVNDVHNTDASKYTIPSNLEAAIHNTLSNIYVVQIKIYSRDGTIVYSTHHSKLILDSDNSGFTSAISGKVSSKVEYNDIFTLLRKPSDIENLVESYLPVRESETSPVLGVFEIYTDVSPVINEVKHTEIMIILGVVVILFLLYGLLVTIVTRAANTIENQQSVIKERTHTLEMLCSQLINSEEDEKREMARDLHENIAQTLAGAKNVIETALTKLPEQKANRNGELQQSVKMLQDSISEIRTLAMELRPPSLDDFGLIKTLGWLCRQYQMLYPEIRIETELDLDESGLADTQKSIIYRVVQDTLHSIASEGEADKVNIKLYKTDNTITLVIEDNSVLPETMEMKASPSIASTIPLYTMQKRTMLSGGIFSIEKKSNGTGIVASSSWVTV